MASTFSLRSQQLPSFPLPPTSKWSNTNNHCCSTQLFDDFTQRPSFQNDCSSFVSTSSGNNNGTDSTLSHYRLVVETSENKETSSQRRPKILLKFRVNKRNNKNDHDQDAVDQNQTLASPRNHQESEKVVVSVKKSTEKRDNVKTVEHKAVADHAVGQTLAAARNDEQSEKLKAAKKKSKASHGGQKIKKNPDTKSDKNTDDNEEHKKKRPFSISLTREEIEADIAAMGGSKRARRHKKTPKSTQRVLDDLFPGLRLKSVTLNDYRVPDMP